MNFAGKYYCWKEKEDPRWINYWLVFIDQIQKYPAIFFHIDSNLQSQLDFQSHMMY